LSRHLDYVNWGGPTLQPGVRGSLEGGFVGSCESDPVRRRTACRPL
jgi:hypothetical protein